MAQLILNDTRLRIGSVHHSNIVVVKGLVALSHSADLACHRLGLITVGHVCREGYAFANLQFGIHLFANLPFVVANERVSRLHDSLGAAVVLLQLAQQCIGVILLEVQNIADIRSAERIDGLSIITYHANMLMRLC